MARPRRKSPDDLMQEAIWNLGDICRLFRKGPKTIMKYINHPDPKKRLPGFMINGEFCAEKKKILDYFRYRPDTESELIIGRDHLPRHKREEVRI